MKGREIRNAVIDDTYLGIEDHGLFIVQIGMDYGATHQAFQHIVTAATCYKVLSDIFAAVGVSHWEELPGKSCRVALDDGLIRQIGHYLHDRWTPDPKEEDAKYAV